MLYLCHVFLCVCECVFFYVSVKYESAFQFNSIEFSRTVKKKKKKHHHPCFSTATCLRKAPLSSTSRPEVFLSLAVDCLSIVVSLSWRQCLVSTKVITTVQAKTKRGAGSGCWRPARSPGTAVVSRSRRSSHGKPVASGTGSPLLGSGKPSQ